MDHKEELCNNNDVNDGVHHIIHKGKRTKRMRLLSTNTTVVMSSCSSASGSDGGGGEDQGSSTMTTDQEEEDMANCLILLAQGGGGGGGGDGDGGSGDSDYHEHHQQQKQQVDQDHGDDGDHKIEIKGRKISEIVTATTTNKVGFYIYECKTCNRTFPSFQALGGHRASHKRPKIMTDEKKLPPPVLPPATSPPQVMDINYDPNQFELGGVGGQLLQPPHIKSVAPINPISLQFGSAQKAISFNGNNNNNKSKIHECSICGSEFSSGQALGGHMRRHRASTNTGSHAMSSIHTISTTAVLEVQPRTVLGLDLNLPAPEEELREPPKLQFTAASQKSMVLSAAPALVDCHY